MLQLSLSSRLNLRRNPAFMCCGHREREGSSEKNREQKGGGGGQLEEGEGDKG